jgi:hypothetical protein
MGLGIRRAVSVFAGLCHSARGSLVGQAKQSKADESWPNDVLPGTAKCYRCDWEVKCVILRAMKSVIEGRYERYIGLSGSDG